VTKRQDFSIFGVIIHRQEPEPREGVGDGEVRQSKQHGLHHRPAVAGDAVSVEVQMGQDPALATAPAVTSADVLFGTRRVPSG
jgi:hypothetical protein